MTDARYKRQKLLDAVLPSIDRLLEAASQHDLGSVTLRRAIEDTERELRALCDSLDANKLSISTDGTDVFINGAPPRRTSSNSALLDALERLDLDRLTISEYLRANDLYDLLSFLAKTRDASAEELAARPHIEISPNIQLDFAGTSPLGARPHAELAASHYAASYAALELIYKDLRVEQHAGQLTHIARLIADDTSREPGALLRALIPVQTDTAREQISLHTAIITAVMMRALDATPGELLDAVFCALLLEASITRALGQRALAEPFDQGHQPAATSLTADEIIEAGVALIASLTRPMSTSRARLIYEVLQRNNSTRRPYQGKSTPAMASVIIFTAYRFVKETIARAPGEGGALDRAISSIAKQRRSRAEGLCLKLLCSCMGIFPVGTMAQLSSGWRGVVLRNHDHPALYERPIVILTETPDGHPLERVVDLALLDQTSAKLGMTHRAIQAPSPRMQQLREEVLAGAFDVPHTSPNDLNIPAETHPRASHRSQTNAHQHSRLDALIQGSARARKTPLFQRSPSQLFE